KLLRFVTALDVSAQRQLRRDAAMLATLRHEHLVGLRATTTTDAGLVLVFDYAEGGSLASLLAARGALTAGEVVAVAAPLAEALATVHANGVTHGDITPANVLFDRSGKPLLADVGVARLAGQAAVAPGGPADVAPGGPAADVRALAAVCQAALTGAAPERGADLRPMAAANGTPPTLVEAIEAALNPDFRSRPDAAGFARALYAACTPRAVRLNPTGPAPVNPAGSAPFNPTGSAAPDPTPSEPSADGPPGPLGAANSAADRGLRAPRHARVGDRRPFRPARRLVAPLLAAGLLAVTALVALAWAAHERPAAASARPTASGQPTAAPPSSDTSWLRVMAALDAARDGAFADGDVDELSGVYVAGSAALAADRRTLDQMADAGQRARGLALRLVSVEVRSQTPTSVELAVRDTLPPYEIVDADGQVRRQPGRGEREWVVGLRATTAGGSWQIATIDAA
ncbi:MAG TPA: protein kinase, partial [Acidothermaceae bacterium]